MPVNTWTPTALKSNQSYWCGAAWRAVEAQHKVSTMALARGNLRDQTTLENILEEFKPKLPPEAEGLHWLLSTPFRYFPPQDGSRFRRKQDPGVFYAAEDRKTACAEVGYWRWRFWCDSEGLRDVAKTVQITLFEFNTETSNALDLTKTPFSDDKTLWTNSTDYSHNQELAIHAREAMIELIRYESVRNSDGKCLAIMTPNILKKEGVYLGNQQTWSLHLQHPEVVWQRELEPTEAYAFRFTA